MDNNSSKRDLQKCTLKVGDRVKVHGQLEGVLKHLDLSANRVGHQAIVTLDGGGDWHGFAEDGALELILLEGYEWLQYGKFAKYPVGLSYRQESTLPANVSYFLSESSGSLVIRTHAETSRQRELSLSLLRLLLEKNGVCL